MNKVEKYVHVSINNAPGRWKGINLHNLANEMSTGELQEALELLAPATLKHAKERLNTVVSLNAPEIVVRNEEKNYKRAQLGKTPELGTLRTALRKRNG